MKEKPTLPRRLARGALAGALFLLAAASPCAALPGDASPYTTRSSVDWKARILSIDVELDLAAAALRLPEGRLMAERMMERDLPALAKNAVFALQADSYRTIEDSVADGSFDSEALVALADLAHAERSSFSKDMRKFLATFTLSLDKVASLFLSGASPSPIRAPLEARPTRAYTGIVVYAKGSLPVHGESVEDKAQPCLFPRIYDSQMNLVLDRSVELPEILASGGVLGYASAIGVEAGERVGSDPMRVMALELFGDRRTDYIISREDALRILSSPGNRELLRQGKVVVVF
jgi:hypothetical protein